MKSRTRLSRHEHTCAHTHTHACTLVRSKHCAQYFNIVAYWNLLRSGLLLFHFTDEGTVAGLVQFIQSRGQWSRDSNISPRVGQGPSSQPPHLFFFFFENYKHHEKYYCDSALANVSLSYHYLIWSSQQPCRGGLINCIQQTRKLRVIGLNISIQCIHRCLTSHGKTLGNESLSFPNKF